MYKVNHKLLLSSIGISLLLFGCGSTGTTNDDIDKTPVVND